jgi:trans-2,3-dihydro-3-hydroxyanthranilate isomerase
MRRYPYVLVDVFTDRPLEGNALAVFPDGRGLSDAEMQALAKETNLSETTFVLPREEAVERERGVQVRIFTVAEELPFAGHPTLGTASVLRGTSGAPQVELELRVGRIPVTFTDAAGGPAFGEMTQREPEFGRRYPRAAVAGLGGLREDDLREDVPVETVSTGNPFLMVPVKTRAAMERLSYDAAAAARFLKDSDAKFLYWVTLETGDPAARARARMIFYNGEDPATGSAAGPAAAWMAHHGLIPSGERVMIEQGVEMGRRSHLYVSAVRTAAGATEVRVGGHTVEVARGEFRLP